MYCMYFILPGIHLTRKSSQEVQPPVHLQPKNLVVPHLLIHYCSRNLSHSSDVSVLAVCVSRSQVKKHRLTLSTLEPPVVLSNVSVFFVFHFYFDLSAMLHVHVSPPQEIWVPMCICHISRAATSTPLLVLIFHFV